MAWPLIIIISFYEKKTKLKLDITIGIVPVEPLWLNRVKDHGAK